MNLLLAASSASQPTASTAPAPPPHHITLSWMLVGILVASLVTWLIFRWRTTRLRRLENSPRKLWRDLCQLHGLRWSEQRLLSRVSRRLKLRAPARLFLEAELWGQALAAATEKHPQERRALRALRSKLIGQRNPLESDGARAIDDARR